MKKIEIDTFLKFQFVSNPTFSPDHSSVAFVVSAANREKNNYSANLYVYNLKSEKVQKLTTGNDAKTYAWTSDNTLLFPADRNPKKDADSKEERTCFYEICPCGGEAEEVFSVPAKVSAIRELSAGRYLLTVKYDNYKETRKTSYEVIDELPFWGNGLGFTNAKRNRFAIYDKASGEMTWIADEWTECMEYSI